MDSVNPVMLALVVLVLCGVFFWICRHPVRGLYLAIFATSVLMTPAMPVVREKFAATELFMVLTWLAMLVSSRRWAHSPSPVLAPQRQAIILGACFIGLVLLSFLAGQIDDPSRWVASTVETLNYTYGFFIFLSIILLVDNKEKWLNCLLAWLLGAALAGLVGVWAVAGGAPAWAYEDFTWRISSTLRNENQVPSLVLPMLIPAVFLAVRRGQSTLYRVLFMGLVAAIMVTSIGSGSRTALGMMVVAVLAVYFLGVKEARYGLINRSLLATIAISFIGAGLLYVTTALALYDGQYALGHTPPWQRPVVMLYEWAQGTRILDRTRGEQMSLVFDNVGEFALLGSGPKLFGELVGSAEIHNTYAAILVEIGIPGLLFFLAWLIYVGWLGWNTGNRTQDRFMRLMILSLVAGLAVLIVYNMFMLGLRQRNIWILAGLLVASPRVLLAAQTMFSSPQSANHPAPNGQRPLSTPAE